MSVVFLAPIFEAAAERGVSRRDMAGALSIAIEGMTDPAVILPASTVYAFLEWLSGRVGEPDFAARTGVRMAEGGWAPILPLLREAGTFGAFLRRFSMFAAGQGASAIYRLEMEGSVALWRLSRPSATAADTRIADAIAAGFFVALLRRVAGAGWNPADIVAVTSDGSFVPDDILPASSVISGAAGFSLRFPSAFLFFDMPETAPRPGVRPVDLVHPAEKPFRDRVIEAIEQSLSDPEADIDLLAQALGMKRWRLQAGLKELGTSVAALRDQLRKDRAIASLKSGDANVSDIAAALGYRSPSNFSRAFRRWTGRSPTGFS